ncbi:MAG: putative DNA binding domain-containing protein [Clostridia bacterium]|jgi:predicted HTH transcriptional regulator|nr:putative DNA binding domain-containing protein [Clostridia bacterium]
MRMDIYKLKKLLERHEGPKLDFKETLELKMETQKKEFVKDICAIANSKGGRGYIVFGIKDKTKEVVGIDKKPYDEEKIQQMICNRCDPPVPVRVEGIEYEGKNLVVVTIFRTNQQPHQMRRNGSFYVRRGSTTDVARREEIANMFQEQGLASYETVIMNKAYLESLDRELMFNKLNIFDKEYNKTNMMLLEGLGVISKDLDRESYHPTIGGLLLFGKKPQKYMPHTGIAINYYDKVYRIEGNILEMVKKTDEKLRELIGDDEYPVEAVKQAVVNALIHRDYWDAKREIFININDNKLEVSNPGAIWQHKKLNRKLKNIIPTRRNPWLYQRMILIDKDEELLKYGFGINKIQEIFKNHGEVFVVNKTYYNLFKIVFQKSHKRENLEIKTVGSYE